MVMVKESYQYSEYDTYNGKFYIYESFLDGRLLVPLQAIFQR
jgi:hypothetical protein